MTTGQQRRRRQAAPVMALGLLVFLASGLLATLRVGGGSTALIVGLAGVVVFVAGVVLWMRSG